jgi:hypothetical protein
MDVAKTEQTRNTIGDKEYFSNVEVEDSDDDISFDDGDDTSLSDESVADSFASCDSDEVDTLWGSENGYASGTSSRGYSDTSRDS